MEKKQYFVFTKDKEGHAVAVIVKWFYEEMSACVYADERNDGYGKELFFVGYDSSSE